MKENAVTGLYLCLIVKYNHEWKACYCPIRWSYMAYGKVQHQTLCRSEQCSSTKCHNLHKMHSWGYMIAPLGTCCWHHIFFFWKLLKKWEKTTKCLLIIWLLNCGLLQWRYMQALACIATQYMPITVWCIWHVLWYVLWYVFLVCIEYIPTCFQY